MGPKKWVVVPSCNCSYGYECEKCCSFVIMKNRFLKRTYKKKKKCLFQRLVGYESKVTVPFTRILVICLICKPGIKYPVT